MFYMLIINAKMFMHRADLFNAKYMLDIALDQLKII